MYKAIVRFADIQDNYTIYNPGDIFPRKGLKVSAARLAELLSPANRRGTPLIAEIKPEKPIKKDLGMNPPTKAEKAEDGPDKAAEKPKRGRKKKDADK